jgi:pimeloyl-ACP methyl ester carboxylesterase
VLDALAAERDVIAVDLPGFGDSPPLPFGQPASAGRLAHAVEGLCEELEVRRPHVAGNSLGAWVALEMAKAGNAASVVGISPAGLWRRPLGMRRFEPQRVGRRLGPVPGLLARTTRGRTALLKRSLARPERIPAAQARALISGYFNSPGYDSANTEMRGPVFELDGFPDIPVTIAWGERDEVVGAPRPERLPPSARYLVLEGCGHMPTWDDPELVVRTILEGTALSR